MIRKITEEKRDPSSKIINACWVSWLGCERKDVISAVLKIDCQVMRVQSEGVLGSAENPGDRWLCIVNEQYPAI